VLCLDGGGVRGFITLILRKIEEETGRHIAELFDVICGTSAGGMIAIMIGRLRMSARECIDEYQKFVRVFPSIRLACCPR
jgi:patatin-like phospholipase/acyl hydrolase